jgi:hypothetical protein
MQMLDGKPTGQSDAPQQQQQQRGSYNRGNDMPHEVIQSAIDSSDDLPF